MNKGGEKFWVQEEKEYPFHPYIIAGGLFHQIFLTCGWVGLRVLIILILVLVEFN